MAERSRQEWGVFALVGSVVAPVEVDSVGRGQK
jgi:hypothetical protein